MSRGPVPGASKVLRVLRESGPRKRAVLVGLCGGEAQFERALESLQRRRLVRVLSSCKGWRLGARA